MRGHLLGLPDIGALERAYSLGAPTLKRAVAALELRWERGLRDDDTLSRLVFINWLSRTEPGWLTGVDEREPPEALLDRVPELSPELTFLVAFMAHRNPAGLGDESRWRRASDELFTSATQRQPESSLFAQWPWVIGRQGEPEVPPRLLRDEINARLQGRGTLGEWFRKQLLERLRQRPKSLI